MSTKSSILPKMQIRPSCTHMTKYLCQIQISLLTNKSQHWPKNDYADIHHWKYGLYLFHIKINFHVYFINQIKQNPNRWHQTVHSTSDTTYQMCWVCGVVAWMLWLEEMTGLSEYAPLDDWGHTSLAQPTQGHGTWAVWVIRVAVLVVSAERKELI